MEDILGVTTVLAVIHPATERQPLRSCTNNIIRVLLNYGSDGDLYYPEKGRPKSFPYSTRQVPKSLGICQLGTSITVKVFEYSAT